MLCRRLEIELHVDEPSGAGRVYRVSVDARLIPEIVDVSQDPDLGSELIRNATDHSFLIVPADIGIGLLPVVPGDDSHLGVRHVEHAEETPHIRVCLRHRGRWGSSGDWCEVVKPVTSMSVFTGQGEHLGFVGDHADVTIPQSATGRLTHSDVAGNAKSTYPAEIVRLEYPHRQPRLQI